MAQLNFDAAQVAPDTGFDPMPLDWYDLAVTASELKPTEGPKGNGMRLACEITVQSGKYMGRKIFTGFNVQNPNPEAVRISMAQLSALAHACGILQVADSEQLHGIPFKGRVKIRPAKGDYDASNEITTYKPASDPQPTNTAANVPQVGGMAAGGQPSWAGAGGGFGGAAQPAGQAAPAGFGMQPQAQPQAQQPQPGFGQQPQQFAQQPQAQQPQAQQPVGTAQLPAQAWQNGQPTQPQPAAQQPQQQAQPDHPAVAAAQQLQPTFAQQPQVAAQPQAQQPAAQPQVAQPQQQAQPAAAGQPSWAAGASAQPAQTPSWAQ